MNLTINIYLEDLKETINRTIKVNDTMLLEIFCEYILVIMNANPKKEYFISINDDEYLSTNSIPLFEDEKYMENITLKDLKLSNNDKIVIYYDGMDNWNIIIEIINIEQGLYNKDFELITGTGIGIVEKFTSTSVINRYLNPTPEDLERKSFRTYLEEFNKYNIHYFNLVEINTKLFNYISTLEERIQPKNYILNISLEEYGREIKRKIAVNDNINLNTFCKAIITSMQGSLVHGYIIRINGEYLDNDTMKKHDLNYLDLKKKKKYWFKKRKKNLTLNRKMLIFQKKKLNYSIKYILLY